MKRATLEFLSLLVFALVLLSFLVRGVGQFVLGPRGVLVIAGPISVLAAGLLVFVLAYWVLARVGVMTLEAGEDGR